MKQRAGVDREVRGRRRCRRSAEVGVSRSWVTLVAAWAGVASETAASAAAPAIAPRRAGVAGMRMAGFLCDACEVSCRVRA